MRLAQAIAKLAAAAATMGGHVEDDSGGGHITLQVCAPPGKVWRESYSVHLVISCHHGRPEWLADAVADGLERITHGVIDSPEV